VKENLYYIINQDNQLGPYSKIEILKLKRKNLIDDSSSFLNLLDESEQSFEEFFYKPKSNNSYKKISFVALSMILALSFTFYFNKKSKIEISRPNQLSFTKFKKIKKRILKSIEKNENYFEVIQSKDLKNTWLVTNYDAPQKVKIKFTSLPNKTLGNEEIAFYSTLKTKEAFSEIKTFLFEQGDRITPGIYELEIHLLEREQRLSNSKLKSFKIYKTKTLLAASSKKAFKKELKAHLTKSSQKKNEELEELKMNYQTLQGIVVGISDDLKSSNSIKEFEKSYTNKYGRFFTDFVTNNQKKKNLLKQKPLKNIDYIAHYNSLSSLAQKIGLISVDLINDSKKDPKKAKMITVEKYQELFELFEQKVSNLDQLSSLVEKSIKK
jgi:hypothetical protein